MLAAKDNVQYRDFAAPEGNDRRKYSEHGYQIAVIVRYHQSYKGKRLPLQSSVLAVIFKLTDKFAVRDAPCAPAVAGEYSLLRGSAGFPIG